MKLRGGKNWTPIFQAYLTHKEAKNAIKSILAKTFNFRHFSDIRTRLYVSHSLYHTLEVGRLTEKPNWYPIFLKTETDTDFGILKTGKYRIPTKNNRKNRYSRLFPPEATILHVFHNTVESASMTMCVGCVKLVLCCISTIFFTVR